MVLGLVFPALGTSHDFPLWRQAGEGGLGQSVRSSALATKSWRRARRVRRQDERDRVGIDVAGAIAPVDEAADHAAEKRIAEGHDRHIGWERAMSGLVA